MKYYHFKNFTAIPFTKLTMMSHAYDPKILPQWEERFYASLDQDRLPYDNTDIYYIRKPKLLSFTHAYVSEQAIAFRKDHSTIHESLPEYWQVFDQPPASIFSYEPTLWNNLLKSLYSKFYPHKKLVDFMLFRRSQKKNFKAYEQRIFNDKNTQYVSYEETALLWFDAYYSTFGDFLEYMFPALFYALQHLPEKVKNTITILLPPKEHPAVKNPYFEGYMKPMLDSLQIDRYKVRHLSLGTLSKYKKLWIPYGLNPFDAKNAFPALDHLKKYYITPTLTQKYTDFKRVFIDRNPSKQTVRQILNKEDVFKVLKKYDFKILYIEDYSLQEAINLLQNTQLMVATDSSAGTNFLFTNFKQHPRLLRLSYEIQPHIAPLVDFDLRLSLRKLQYDVLLCHTEGENWYNANLLVDCEQLEQKIQAMIA